MAGWRLRWTLIGGSVLQVLVIASGAVVAVMYILGAIFAHCLGYRDMARSRAEQAGTR